MFWIVGFLLVLAFASSVTYITYSFGSHFRIVDDFGPWGDSSPSPETDGWVTDLEAAGDVDHEPVLTRGSFDLDDIEPLSS